MRTMDSIVFGFIIIVLLIAFGFYVWETNKEKAKLVNALVAKNPEQYRDLTLADKVEHIKQQPMTPPDLVPEQNLSQQEWENAIANQLKESKEEQPEE